MALPPDHELMQLMLESPLEPNAHWARLFDVSRERVRQKRAALGLPSTRAVQSAKSRFKEAQRHRLTKQLCITCKDRMPWERVRRGWLNCSHECAEEWRKLPGPYRQRLRRRHFDGNDGFASPDERP